MSYTAGDGGVSEVAVLLMGQHIAGSPFAVSVGDGASTFPRVLLSSGLSVC